MNNLRGLLLSPSWWHWARLPLFLFWHRQWKTNKTFSWYWWRLSRNSSNWQLYTFCYWQIFIGKTLECDTAQAYGKYLFQHVNVPAQYQPSLPLKGRVKICEKHKNIRPYWLVCERGPLTSPVKGIRTPWCENKALYEYNYDDDDDAWSLHAPNPVIRFYLNKRCLFTTIHIFIDCF